MLRKILENSRFVLVLPVIGSLLLAIGAVVTGLGVILFQGYEMLRTGEFSAKVAKSLSVAVIQTIDLFLVGAIGYITAVGIYKLFISQREEQLLRRVKIETLVDLENKIIGVVVAALAVAFLGDATGEDADALSIFHSGIGTALVIGALCLFVRFSSGPPAAPKS